MRSTSGVTGAAGGLTRGTIPIVKRYYGRRDFWLDSGIVRSQPEIESGTQFVLQTTSALTLTKEPKQK